MQKKYDIVIVGASFSGLLLASLLKKSGRSIAVLDPDPVAGGSYKPIQNNFEPSSKWNNGLVFLPDSPVVNSGLNLLQRTCPNLKTQKRSLRPLEWHNQGLREFAGFGNSTPKCLEIFEYFLCENWIQIEPCLGSLVEELAASNADLLHPKNMVTQLDIEGNIIQSLTLNGTAKKVEADWVIFCAPLKSLVHLLDGRSDQSLAPNRKNKNKGICALGLDIVTSLNSSTPNNSLPENMLLLKDDTADSEDFFVGQFSGATHSQWLTFIDEDRAEDPEEVRLLLKKLKKQIRKVQPTIFDKILFERVGVWQDFHFLKANSFEKQIPKNMFLASPQFSEKIQFEAVCERWLACLETDEIKKIPFEFVNFEFSESDSGQKTRGDFGTLPIS